MYVVVSIRWTQVVNLYVQSMMQDKFIQTFKPLQQLG